MNKVEGWTKRQEPKEVAEGAMCLVISEKKTQRGVIAKTDPLTIFLLDECQRVEFSQNEIIDDSTGSFQSTQSRPVL